MTADSGFTIRIRVSRLSSTLTTTSNYNVEIFIHSRIVEQWVKKNTFQFEVVVRVMLNVENLTLILKPQSAIS